MSRFLAGRNTVKELIGEWHFLLFVLIFSMCIDIIRSAGEVEWSSKSVVEHIFHTKGRVRASPGYLITPENYDRKDYQTILQKQVKTPLI